MNEEAESETAHKARMTEENQPSCAMQNVGCYRNDIIKDLRKQIERLGSVDLRIFDTYNFVHSMEVLSRHSRDYTIILRDRRDELRAEDFPHMGEVRKLEHQIEVNRACTAVIELVRKAGLLP